MSVQTTVDELRARPGTGDTIAIIDPVTEEQFAEFTDGGAAAVDEAVGRARESFESGVWQHLPQAARAKVLWRIADLLEARAGELAELDSLNTGMPLAQAEHNINAAVEFFQYFSGWCTKVNGTAFDIRQSGGLMGADLSVHAYTLKEPVGVVGLIVPWNGPGVQRRRQAGAGARRRVQQHPQAGRGDPALGAGVRAGARRGRRARRRGEHRERATATPPARPSSTTPASTRSPSPAPPRWARRSSRARPATSSG